MCNYIFGSCDQQTQQLDVSLNAELGFSSNPGSINSYIYSLMTKRNTPISASTADIYQAHVTSTYKENNEQTLFDEGLREKYFEKEKELKIANTELEKKSKEILSKIERIRNIYTNKNVSDFGENVYEVGQGDAPAIDENGYGLLNSTDPDLDTDLTERPMTADLSFSSPELLLPKSSFGSASPQLISKGRPKTAVGIKPLHGLPEKAQARLQKATESVLKCVQSKLINYEKRMADMNLQFRQKIQENIMLESKVKALEEDRRRLLKTVYTLQCTTDKFSKSIETSKVNLNMKAQAFGSLKKEMDPLKRDLRHKNDIIQSLQARLDRNTEENRLIKSQYESTQLNRKQQQREDRAAMEELKKRLAQLEQQKTSLQSTVEKQAHLIKNSRTQNTFPVPDKY